MPEKQKDAIVKSKSVQGFHKPHEIEDGPNIFERQVDSISTAADCDKTISEKSSTLPTAKSLWNLLYRCLKCANISTQDKGCRRISMVSFNKLV